MRGLAASRPAASSGVVKAWSGRQVDVSVFDRVPAPVAVQVRPDAAPAAGVERETRWPRRRRVVAVAPLHERDQRRAELTTLVGDDVLRPAGPLRVGNALEHALVAQEPEAAGER